jgi:hypothetical protein
MRGCCCSLSSCMQRLFKPMKTLVLFRTLDSSESNGNSPLSMTMRYE